MRCGLEKIDLRRKVVYNFREMFYEGLKVDLCSIKANCVYERFRRVCVAGGLLSVAVFPRDSRPYYGV